jgi:hypothetical protein
MVLGGVKTSQDCKGEGNQMNAGNMVTEALRRNGLSVSDIALRDMTTNLLNEIIQEHWHKFQKFTKSTFYILTADNVEEYSLNKLSGRIIKNTMRGSDPIRQLSFKPSHEFLNTHQGELETGDPYYYRDGEFYGCSKQPSASSVITFVSSLANYTTGTLTVTYGSRRIVIATGAITLDMIGRWIRVGTDSKRYRISSMESSSIFYVSEPYEGTTSTTATFAIGDVQQKGIVLGLLDNGAAYEEEVQLNGVTQVSTTTSFAAIIRIMKSDKTHGYVTATSNAGVVVNAILDPGETEAEWDTVKLAPIPVKEELITYESYAKHPWLYKGTDSPLYPNQFHPFLQLELFIRVRTEWTEKDPSQETIRRRDSMFAEMMKFDNDLSNWDFQQEVEGYSEDYKHSNLPNNFSDE